MTVPVSLVVATQVGKRAQPQFVQQWKTTGKLNAHIEEMYTGHSLVKVFGRPGGVRGDLRRAERGAVRGPASGRSSSPASIQPLMMFIGNLNYVLVAVVGGLRVASGALSIGDVQAFVQYSRQFSQPLTQVASMANLIQSGVASAERVFELLDAEEQSSRPGARRPARRSCAAGSRWRTCRFRYDAGQAADRGLSLKVEPGHTVAIVGPTGAGKTTLVNLLMRFYEVSGGRITLDGIDIAAMSREELRVRDRHGAPGHLAVRRHHRGEHRATATRAPPASRSRRRPAPRTPTGSSGPCRTATTRSSTTRAPGSARARSS